MSYSFCDAGEPVRDYPLILPFGLWQYANYAAVAHVRVRTSAEQPEGVLAPSGWQDFNAIVEAPGIREPSYYGITETSFRRKAIKELQISLEAHMTYWDANDISFVLPHAIWIMDHVKIAQNDPWLKVPVEWPNV